MPVGAPGLLLRLDEHADLHLPKLSIQLPELRRRIRVHRRDGLFERRQVVVGLEGREREVFPLQGLEALGLGAAAAGQRLAQLRRGTSDRAASVSPRSSSSSAGGMICSNTQ